jgi:hypothetical protein
MLNGFLSAFARAIIRRRDEELSVDGCRDFGTIRLSTEGFAVGVCDVIDEAARRCSTQGVDLSTPFDLCAFLCGTRTPEMIYVRILWLMSKLWTRSTLAYFSLPPQPRLLDHTMDAFGEDDEFQRAQSAFPALDDDLDGFASIPPAPVKSTSASVPLDFDFDPAPAPAPAVHITDDDEIGQFESQFPDIGGTPEVSSHYVFMDRMHLANSSPLLIASIRHSTICSYILSEPCVWCLSASTSRILPSTNLFSCIP